VAGIFAKENGQGLAFQPLDSERGVPTMVPVSTLPDNGGADKPKPTGGGRPKLQVVK